MCNKSVYSKIFKDGWNTEQKDSLVASIDFDESVKVFANSLMDNTVGIKVSPPKLLVDVRFIPRQKQKKKFLLPT